MEKLKCRNEDCEQVFANASNRLRHEKRFNHLPPTRTDPVKPIFDPESKLFRCNNNGCFATSKKKGNMIRHIKSCASIMDNKKRFLDNKTCQHCGMKFVRKSNRDRHVNTFHPGEPNNSVMSVNANDTQNIDETDDDLLTDYEPVSMVADDFVPFQEEQEQAADVIIEEEEIDAVDLPDDVTDRTDAENPYFGEEQTSDLTTSNQDSEELINEKETENPTTSGTHEESVEPMSNLLKELSEIKQKRNKAFDNTFISKIPAKLTSDLKNRFDKHSAAKFIVESFGEMVNDFTFIAWLAQKLNYKPQRLQGIIKSYQNFNKPIARRSLASNVHQSIYEFWKKPENCITSTDRRSGRDEVRIGKLKYLSQYKHLHGIVDETITEKEVLLKKTGNVKKYICAQRMVYTQPIRKLHEKYLKDQDIKCSVSTFIKYKPFYITNPTEREKESCLCKRCQNAHLLLEGINNFRKASQLPIHTSVTVFLKECNTSEFPECTAVKEVTFYIFETKEEFYIKNGEEKSYERCTRVDKKEPVSKVVERLLSTGENYLRHRSHVKNVNKVLPSMRDSHDGRYIELDFSENLAFKPKFEVQDAHFSGKQFTLHCSIVTPGPVKYVYHLSDDTNHDPTFVHAVVKDIFDRWSIKNETVIIKSDNAPTQYKNKYAFESMQQLADDYNVKIVRIYGAAGHGKGLIDAMSSFGVKAILRRDIIAVDKWFNYSNEICDYLSLRRDDRMIHVHIDAASVDKMRRERLAKPLDGCLMMGALISYNASDPVYLVRVESKGIAEEVLRDRYGHLIRIGDHFLKGKYLQKTRSRNINRKQFKYVEEDVYLTPDEIFEAFVEIDESLSISNDIYLQLIERASY